MKENQGLQQLLDSYPKSAAALNAYCKKLLLKVQEEMVVAIPEGTDYERPEVTDEMSTMFAKSILATNPRILYDFFDAHEIYILINYVVSAFKGEDCNVWNYMIFGEYSMQSYGTRKAAEIGGFKEAFKILEEKLEDETVSGPAKDN